MFPLYTPWKQKKTSDFLVFFMRYKMGVLGRSALKIALCPILFYCSKFMEYFAWKRKWSILVQSLAVSPACGKPRGPRNSLGIDDLYADDWNWNV